MGVRPPVRARDCREVTGRHAPRPLHAAGTEENPAEDTEEDEEEVPIGHVAAEVEIEW